jgi:hypothetical protein
MAVHATVRFGRGPAFATSISGRKVLDQYGDVFLMRSMASWTLYDLSAANITTMLEAINGRGFNAVTVWAGGGYDLAADYIPYATKVLLNGSAGNDPWWTGSPWVTNSSGSGMGAAWTHMDHIVDECLRLGMVVNMSLCLSWGNGGAADMATAGTSAMQNVGAAVANRYPIANYPNIVWHAMYDSAYSGTNAATVNAYYTGVNNVEGSSARPVRWTEPNGLESVWDVYIDPDNTPAFGPTMNGFYDNGFSGTTWANCAENVQASYAEAAIPTGNTEAFYDGSPWAGGVAGDFGQQLREQSVAVFLEGGMYINYSHMAWYPFGKSGEGDTEGLAYTAVPDHVHTVQMSYIWALIDLYVADTTWAPTTAFVTTGTGSGNTKAAVGASNTAALAYFPNSRTISVDTTILTGTGNVRLRWWDPTNNTYTSIAASEAQQIGRSVTHPGNTSNSAGVGDWMLVVDLA